MINAASGATDATYRLSNSASTFFNYTLTPNTINNTVTITAQGERSAVSMPEGETLNVTGSAPFTYNGTVNGAAANNGALRITNTDNSGAVFNGAIGNTNPLAALTVGDAASTSSVSGRAVFNSTVNVGSLGIAKGSATFNRAATVVTTGGGSGALTLEDGTTIVVGSGFRAGQTVIRAAGAITDSGTITIDVSNLNLDNGQSVTVIDAGSGTTDTTYAIRGSNTFVSYAAVVNDVNDTVSVRAATKTSVIINSGQAVTLDGGAFTYSGRVDGSVTGRGTLNIRAGGNLVTFNGVVGGIRPLGTVAVGSSTEAGNALFGANVRTANFTITGGNAANGSEDSVTRFRRNLTTTSRTTLNDNGSNLSTATFEGSVAQTVSSPITAASAGEGTVVVNNTLVSGTAVWFTRDVGTRSVPLRAVNLLKGNTVFAGGVHVRPQSETVTETTDTADANAHISALSGLFLKGTTRVRVAGDLSGQVTFEGDGTLVLDGESAQSVTGTLATRHPGQGRILVSNPEDTVTFNGAIGGALGDALGRTHPLAELKVGQGSSGVVFGGTVYVGRLIVASGNITFHEPVTVQALADTQGGDIQLGDDVTLTLSSDLSAGQTVITADGVLRLTGTLTIDVGDLNLDPGQSLTVIDAEGIDRSPDHHALLTGSDAFTRYTVTLDDLTHQITVTAHERTAALTHPHQTPIATRIDNGAFHERWERWGQWGQWR